MLRDAARADDQASEAIRAQGELRVNTILLRLLSALVVLTAGAAVARPAAAATTVYCVGSPQEFDSALEAAASADATTDSDIRMRPGSYTGTGLSADTRYAFSARIWNSRALTLSGGWTGASCDTQHNDPRLSVIDGAGSIGGLHIRAMGPVAGIRIRWLTIANAMTNDPWWPAALFVEAAGDPSAIKLEAAIIANNGDGSGNRGVVVLRGDTSLIVRNTLFVGNAGRNISALELSSTSGAMPSVAIGNNTFVDNTATGAGGSVTTFVAANAAVPAFDNNIFWHNILAAADQAANIGSALQPLARNNIIELLSSQTGAWSFGPGSHSNVEADPQFVGVNDFRVKPGSPARNAGYADPASGFVPFDIIGHPRVMEGAIDIGAYENDGLFADGFGGSP